MNYSKKSLVPKSKHIKQVKTGDVYLLDKRIFIFNLKTIFPGIS